MHNHFYQVAALASISFGLAACSGSGASPQVSSPGAAVAGANVDQDTLCETKTFNVVDNCKSGQKVIFLPSSFGNEQLPVLFAALNCDLRYNVALTKGAVACIFKQIKPEAPAAAASEPASGTNK
jgi:hypothetical protein